MSNLKTIDIHQLAGSIPDDFGFMPTESIVVVWLGENDETVLTQRSNISDSGDLDDLLAVGHSQGFDKAIFVIYTDKSFADNHEWICDFHISLLRNVESDIATDIIHVSHGRAWSYFSHDKDNPGGLVVSNTTQTRDDLIKEVTPTGEESDYINAQGHWIAFENHTDKETMRDDMIDAVRNVYLSGNQGVEESHLISVALQDVRVRDSVLWLVNSLEKEELPDLYEVTASVCRDVHTRGSAALLTVAGIIAWSMGNGAKANVCIDLALESDSRYSLARMIRQMLDVGMSPEFWADSINSLTYDESRKGVN